MSLCLAGAGVTIELMTGAFTLAWVHSVEKIPWEEDWLVEPGRLVLVASRVRGSGAGMEPPEGSVLRDGVWTYRPRVPPVPELVLARSREAGDWRICFGGSCRSVSSLLGSPPAGEPARLRPCP